MNVVQDSAPPVFVRERDLERLHTLLDEVEVHADVDALRDELDRATVVADPSFPDDVVSMGSVVTYREGDSARTATIRIVYPWDADPSAGRVSVLAPVASALFGLRAGSTIEWRTSSGRSFVWSVVSVAAEEGDLL